MVRAMTAADRRAVDKVLGLYFDQRQDGFHQGRVDAELRIAQSTIARQRESGAESAAKRWGGKSTHKLTDGLTDRSTNTSNDGLQHTRGDTTTNHQPPTTTRQPPESRARGTRLPADWSPSEEQIQWAITERPAWDRSHVSKVADLFRDHWISQPGQKGVKTAWDATWRNWVRRENSLKPNQKTIAMPRFT